jgi:hypothetical protein
LVITRILLGSLRKRKQAATLQPATRRRWPLERYGWLFSDSPVERVGRIGAAELGVAEIVDAADEERLAAGEEEELLAGVEAQDLVGH